ncbi:YfhO family protein [Vaginisenegalia massiliensis]|uniref:YfhO family protein n=1 Tax=Vaginisenegalia massiliensis TaxID=2058294 RepID=UPI000F51B1EB|nr:YfhO family protein [Vaginisenegalia massiliensis]
MKKKLVYLLSAIMPVLVILVSWKFNDFYPFGNKTLMAVDFGYQYIDLFAFMRKAILSGDWSSFAYSFSKSLGGTTVGMWAYYLMSPFNLIYLFFKPAQFPIAVVLIILLRYAAMGLSFAYFLTKRYPAPANRQGLIVLFATIYALNGFNVAYQMNVIFFDILVMLPLLLVGLEELLDGGKPLKFCVMLAISVVMQFYMAYMACIFIVFYAIYYVLIHQEVERTVGQRLGDLVKRLGRLALYAILSVAVIAAFVSPVLFNLMNSKGQLQSGMTFEWKFQLNPLDILAKFMMGAFDNKSWSAGPSLPNIYVASLGLAGSIYFFVSKQFRRLDKAVAASILLIFFFSICHEFTSKLWHMGQNPAGFFHRFSWLIAFFLLFLAYRAFRYESQIDKKWVGFGLILTGLWYGVVQTHTYSFLLDWQVYASIICMLTVILALTSDIKWKWWLVALVTMGELGANAYLSQYTLGYVEADKFADAVTNIDQAVDLVRPGQKDFYRVANLFTRSKNDPFMYDFPGVSNFSSSLEQSTRDVFDRFGSNGINAATTYNGTALTDALFGIEYFMDDKPLEQANAKHYYGFYNGYTRKDIVETISPIKETPYFAIYQNPLRLPLAYGVNQATVGIQMVNGQPITNQNKVLQAMAGNKQIYFTASKPHKIVINNIAISKDTAGKQVFSRKDTTKTGLIKFQFTPKTDHPVSLFAPTALSFSDTNQNNITLDGQPYGYLKKFTAAQLFNLSAGAKDKLLSVDVTTQTKEPLNLDNLLFVEQDTKAIRQVLEKRQAQGMTVTSWTNNQVLGTVSISDDSKWMMTSIPYDQGWAVQVDGEQVPTINAWQGFLAYPITKGQHQIKMTYIPPGLYLGLAISAISIFAIAVAIFLLRKRSLAN